MPRLDELNLTAEAVPQVDWDAPEGGSAPPSVGPGNYTLLFKMPEDRNNWFDKITVDVGNGVQKEFLQINYNPQVIGNHEGQPFTPEPGQELPTLMYQRASFFKSDKMLISSGAELLRALGERLTGDMSPQAVEQALERVDGRATFKGDVIWRAYFKSTGTTVSTSPRRKTKKGPELPWPKAADGSPELSVVNPKNPNDKKQFGRAEITRVYSVHDSQTAAKA